MDKFYRTKYFAINLLAAIIIFASGIYIGFNKYPEISTAAGLSGRETPTDKRIDFSTFWRVWDTIEQKYPDASEVSDQEKVYGAISGLLQSLDDPYSVFMDPEEAKSFEEDISGNFIGIGIEVANRDKVLTVVAPLKGTPAERAGLRAGDKILKINNTVTANMSVEEAVKLIRGDRGTSVTLTVLHEEDTRPQEVQVTRDVINLPTLDTELRKDNIFVVKLYSFSSNSVGLFRSAMKSLSQSKTDKLILDLRSNPGGYLDAAVDMASWFIPAGKTVVIEDSGDNKEQKIFRSKGYNSLGENLKVVVLIDEGSASASEILAGALQDYGRAKLVGTRSFGKGSVQEVIRMSGGTIVKLTIAKWLTPNGISISEQGLNPDYLVERTEEDIKSNRDPQMDRAINLLNNWPKAN